MTVYYSGHTLWHLVVTLATYIIVVTLYDSGHTMAMYIIVENNVLISGTQNSYHIVTKLRFSLTPNSKLVGVQNLASPRNTKLRWYLYRTHTWLPDPCHRPRQVPWASPDRGPPVLPPGHCEPDAGGSERGRPCEWCRRGTPPGKQPDA